MFSYSPNYFSIEDILLQDLRVSCTFEVGVPKLGLLLSARNFNDTSTINDVMESQE